MLLTCLCVGLVNLIDKEHFFRIIYYCSKFQREQEKHSTEAKLHSEAEPSYKLTCRGNAWLMFSVIITVC